MLFDVQAAAAKIRARYEAQPGREAPGEGGAAPDPRAILLAAYAAAVEKMRRSRPRVPAGRWWQAQQDADTILMRWGATAAALGWPADSLFACPPKEGECGCLAWEMQGGYVRLMTAGMIVFDRPDVCCRGFFRRA